MDFDFFGETDFLAFFGDADFLDFFGDDFFKDLDFLTDFDFLGDFDLETVFFLLIFGADLVYFLVTDFEIFDFFPIKSRASRKKLIHIFNFC